MSDDPQRPNLFFRLVIVAGCVFLVTIFALVATIFGDPESPVARFLNKHGGTLIAAEVAATLLLGLLAMAVDRFG